MMNNANSINLNRSRPAWSLPGVVFVVAALVLLAGFLVPLPEKVLDILWVFSFCLAGAIVIICMKIRNSSELVGFVPMISGLTLLWLVVQTGTARRIIQDEPAGILLGAVGSALTSTWPIGAVLICLAMAVIIVVVVFAACQKITAAATGYLERVLPLKHIGIENDLRLGVIGEEQANKMSDRVVAEGRFFVGIKGAAILMRSEVAVCIFILLACLAIPLLTDSVKHPSVGIASLGGIASPVVALSVFSMVPAVIVAAACGALMGKEALALRTEKQSEPDAEPDKKIKVVSSVETGISETTEPPMDDPLDTEPDMNEIINAEPFPDSSLPVVPHERIAEFEPDMDGSLPIPVEISCQDAKEYYEKLCRIIDAVDSRPRVVVLASEHVQSLPVTVAVNTAIHLAQKNRKVLLIDTDRERNAVAQVFDLDPMGIQKKIVPSCLENLSVGCVPWEKQQVFLRKSEILSRFDTTLIYMPAMPAAIAIESDGLAAAIGAFCVIDDSDSTAGWRVAEKLAFCSWIRLIPSLQSALSRKS